MSKERSKREQIEKAQKRDHRRRRRERVLIVVASLMIGALLYLVSRFSKVAAGSTLVQPFIDYFFIFAVWALILVLILVLVFLIVRNVAKFFFERRKGVLGARLRNRLILAFVVLTVGPAAVLFLLSTFILNTSIERLYSPHVLNVVERSKEVIDASSRISEAAREIVEGKYEADGEDAVHFAGELSRQIASRRTWVNVVTGRYDASIEKPASDVGKQPDKPSEDGGDGPKSPGEIKPDEKTGGGGEGLPKNADGARETVSPGGEPADGAGKKNGAPEALSGSTAESQNVPRPGDFMSLYLGRKRQEYKLAVVAVFDSSGKIVARSAEDGMPLPEVPLSDFERTLEGNQGFNPPVSIGEGAIIYAFHPVPVRKGEEVEIVGGLLVGRYIDWIPEREWHELAVAEDARAEIQEYEILTRLELPISLSFYVLLLFVTLVVIFLAIWFGFYMAKGITEPIQLLAEGTEMVASGDLDYKIDIGSKGDDEISTLVAAFNKMTSDLSTSRARLQEAYHDISETNLELEQRRSYMETVLGHVTTGVVSVDEEGLVSTVNARALRMLDKRGKNEVVGRPLDHVFRPEEMETIRGLVGEVKIEGAALAQRQVTVIREQRSFVQLISVTPLEDERGDSMGLVLMIEDMTDIIRAHRAMAWREVARRIAHEIKNPLTPIQLAAQRLERRYAERLSGEDETVFRESVRTIIRQVEELKHLVNEFSLFARLPSTNPVPSDLHDLVREVLPLYREAHPEVVFELIEDTRLPKLDIDREQMKRVLINLVDNAVASIEGEGEVAVETMYNQKLQIVRMEVRDTGPGIPPRVKERLFEPYYSTKHGGSGLGLTIVQRIISDHYGYIRVADNEPRGTRMVIELPVVLGERRVEEGDAAKTM